MKAKKILAVLAVVVIILTTIDITLAVVQMLMASDNTEVA